MARPKKDAEERRASPLSIRLTDDERAQIEESSIKAGMSASEYVRMLALGGRIVIAERRFLDPAVFDELRRIGVNLNQLTKLAHVKENMPPALPRLCADLERFLAKQLDGYGPEDRR